MADFTKPAVMNLAAVSSPLAPNTTQIQNGPCRLFGVYVNTVLSGHTVAIQNYTTAESPLPTAVTLVTLPASMAAGTSVQYPGIEFSKGMRVVPNISGTGSITLAIKQGTAATLHVQG